MGDTKHAVYSASGASRWLSCPGSIALSRLAPKQPDSKYAQEGQDAHACAEFFLRNIDKDFSKVRRLVAKKYSVNMIEHAIEYANWIKSQLGLGQLLIETRVDSSPFTTDGQFGTLDAAILDDFDDRLVVIDYKYGAGVAVDPEGYDGNGNPQLVYYALALSFALDHCFSTIDLVVIQPRAFHATGQTIRTFSMTREQLLAWTVTFSQGVSDCEMANESFRESPHLVRKDIFNSGEWCRFCPAAVICPALKTQALAEAEVVFSEVTGVKSLPAIEGTIPNLTSMLRACDKLEVWIGKVREHAYHVLSTGGTVEGYKLVERRAQRKWKEGVDWELEMEFGDAIYETPKMKSPAQLEKTFPKAKKLINKHTITKSSGLTMVSADDRRGGNKSYQDVSHVFGVIDV